MKTHHREAVGFTMVGFHSKTLRKYQSIALVSLAFLGLDQSRPTSLVWT